MTFADVSTQRYYLYEKFICMSSLAKSLFPSTRLHALWFVSGVRNNTFLRASPLQCHTKGTRTQIREDTHNCIMRQEVSTRRKHQHALSHSLFLLLDCVVWNCISLLHVSSLFLFRSTQSNNFVCRELFMRRRKFSTQAKSCRAKFNAAFSSNAFQPGRIARKFLKG